jgi:hypothetical protein
MKPISSINPLKRFYTPIPSNASGLLIYFGPVGHLYQLALIRLAAAADDGLEGVGRDLPVGRDGADLGGAANVKVLGDLLFVERLSALATMRPSRRWGTQICS